MQLAAQLAFPVSYATETAAALGALLAFSASTAFAQGSLTPPGPPAPAMKALSQVEPRTPVDNVNTPGDSVSEFNLSQTGSYYLTTNIVGVGAKYGIRISASNVTLDLNGFALLGATNSYSGIYIGSTSLTNIIVRNGAISAWNNGGYDGIFSVGQDITFEHLTFSGNFEAAHVLGNTTIRDCTINDSLANGLWIACSGAYVLNNTLAGNDSRDIGGDAAIYVTGSNNRIDGNHVSGVGPAGNGILIATATSCTNNILIRNSVMGGGANNYSFNSSQIAGPLITTTGTIANSNPWANFSF